MDWKLNIITYYFTYKNILLFFLFCCLSIIGTKSKYLNYLDKSLIFAFPIIYFYPSIILHKDIVGVYGKLPTNYSNLILIATYIVLLFFSIYSNFLGIRNIKFIKLENSQLIQRIYSTFKNISRNKILGYVVCIFSFLITYKVIPSTSSFHFSNILKLFTDNYTNYENFYGSRFLIYNFQIYTLIISKIIIPALIIIFFIPKYSFLPFFLINILNINMFAERQGLIIITALTLVKTLLYKNISYSKKYLISFMIFILFIFCFSLNFLSRDNTIDLNQFLSLKSTFFSVLASLWGRTILDPYFMLVACNDQQLGYVSAAGILQQLNYYFGIFSPLVFALTHLIFSRMILSPIQIKNNFLKFLSSFLYLYWIFYIDFISIIPIFIVALSIFPNKKTANFTKLN